MNVKRIIFFSLFLSIACISNSFAQDSKWVLFIKDTDKLEYYYDSATIKQTDKYIEVWYSVDNYSQDVARMTGLVRLYCKSKEVFIKKHVTYYTNNTKTTDDYPKGKSRKPITPNSMLDYLFKALCN